MHSSKSSLFLMEMIISILFFSLASAVCIQLFVKSYTLRQNSVNLNQAVIQAENMAEFFYACGGSYTEILQTNKQTANRCFTGFDDATQVLWTDYDADWNVCTNTVKTAGCFRGELLLSPDSIPEAETSALSQSDIMTPGYIRIYETATGKVIYTLSLQYFTPEGRRNE